MSEPVYKSRKVHIYQDSNGYYYTEQKDDGIEGNYYDRDIWPPHVMEVLQAYIIQQIANRFAAIAPILRGDV